MPEYRDLTERIIGLAIGVRRETKTGQLEPVHAACLGFELEQAGICAASPGGHPNFLQGHSHRWASAWRFKTA
jgi:hypothetical protein